MSCPLIPPPSATIRPPQTKRYDEVIEEYRRSIYSLRRLILQGSAQQRTQV